MYYELALISVVIAGVYWGQYFVRKQPHGTITFGVMQLLAAGLAAFGVYAHRTEEAPSWMGTAGAVGLGAGTILLVVGPGVRGLARRFAAAERLGVAERLLDVAEVLAPGSGVADEKALIAAMKEIRDGRIEQTVDALVAAKDRVAPDTRLAIDERIAMLYLAASRWEDAIAHAESHLFEGETAREDARRATSSPEPDTTPPSLRRALGIAPPVWVELLGAYGRTGDLDRAARMLARLEDVCEGRADAAVWVHRGRLMFLALAGRASSVQALVDPRRARHMTVGARSYWLAVAHEHHGDRAAATAAYEKARTRSKGRPRELIDRALENLAKADGITGVTLSDEASRVVARIEAAPLIDHIAMPSAPRPWATWFLTCTLLVSAAASTFLVGPLSDVGVMMRSGAMIRGIVDGGEWWRVFSNILVHIGGLHLLVSVLGTWFVGRIAEQMFGTTRTLALFGASGIVGSIASYLAPSPGIAAGASSALFGVLGAMFVELTWHRSSYKAAWKRGIWGGLVLLIGGQLVYGFMYPFVDQWAHIAAMAAGVVFGTLLSPHAAWVKLGRQLGRAIAIVAVSFLAVAAVRVARTSIEASLQRMPRIRHVTSGVSIAAPASWHTGVALSEPDGLVIVVADRRPSGDVAPQLERWFAAVPEIARRHGFERIDPATDRVVELPEGWEGRELIATFSDPIGTVQRYRVIAAGRVIGDDLVTIAIHTPDTIARSAPRYFARLLQSVRLASPPPPGAAPAAAPAPELAPSPSPG